MKYSKYIISSIILLIFDLFWVSLVINKKYKAQTLKIQKSKMEVNLKFAVFSYILMLLGLNLFVIPNIRKNHEFIDSLKYGALFGLICYGIYDFTCASIFKEWNIKLAFLDIIWGSFVFFISSYLGSKISYKL